MPNPTVSRRWPAVLVAAVVVLQVAVPAIAMTQPKPARLGFQMYSGYGAGSITVLDAHGEEIPVDAASLLPRNLRPELDWTQHVPQHFCAAISEAATVVIEQDATGRTSVSCE
jgi:hypothetical protein